MPIEMHRVTPPPELQAIFGAIGRASGHSILVGIHTRHIEAHLYAGPEWAALNPKPEPNRIKTKQTIGEERELTIVRTEYLQGFIADIPTEHQAPGAPTNLGCVVRAAIEAHYRVDDVLVADNQTRQAFAKVNGIMVTWPYWREWVASSLARLGMAGETAPFMNIPKAIHMAGLFDVEKLEAEVTAVIKAENAEKAEKAD